MGDEIGFVTSRTSTIRTDMAFGFRMVGFNSPSLRAKRSNPTLSHKAKIGLLRRKCSSQRRKASGRALVAKIRLDRAMDLDGERVTVAILGGGPPPPPPPPPHATLLVLG